MSVTWTFKIYDRQDNFLADVSTVTFNKRGSWRLNRPVAFYFEVSADSPLVNTLQADGDPVIAVGTRCLRAYRNGPSSNLIRFNGILWTTQATGDENTARVAVTCYDPLVWLQTRPVRDSTGNMVNPVFTSPISGGSIVKAIVDNTITYDGAVGIDTSFPLFDTAIPPATNLAVDLVDWPLSCGELITRLTDTGEVDIELVPCEGEPLFATGTMSILGAKNQLGNDFSGIFNFDYGTGNYNVKNVRRVKDMTTLANDISYYLGPATASGYNQTLNQINASSQTKYGVFTSWRVYDAPSDTGMYTSLLATESLLRNKPRELLYVTPVSDVQVGSLAFGTFDPFDGLYLGDIVSINVGAALGEAFSASQRVYGFDIDISDDAVESVSELITSADAE